MTKPYEELVELINVSERTVFDESWVSQELFALRTLGGSEGFLTLKGTGKKYTNDSNSTIAFLIGITDNAPLESPINLHAGRIEPPDIDMDFEDRRRDEVKNYMLKKWKNGASISTYLKFSSKGLIRDLSRVFAIPLGEVNNACKHFETLEEYFELDQKDLKAFRQKYPELGEFAKKFEGRWRGNGMHAAGMVLANKKLQEIMPLESRTSKDKEGVRIPVSAFDMDDCGRLGLIKMDLLGISALSVIQDTLKLIDLDIDHIDLEDPEVLSEFSYGHTIGTFQTEAGPYKTLLKRMGIDNFNDLVASNALVRPGPLLTVTDSYIKRKKGKEPVPEEHELVMDITNETHGLFVYQEQLILALVNIGGFSWGEADKVRKIIGKKRDPEEFKPYEEKWVENASKHLGKAKATRLWNDFLKFAGYAFNKSHSVGYSLLSYQTMYLKCKYPLEYMASLLKNEKDMAKTTTLLLEAKRMGIVILPPDVNISMESFEITDEKIRFGLSNIKGLGKAAVKEILENRPFKSFDDFVERTERRKCNSKVINSLKDVGGYNSIESFDLNHDRFYELLGIPGYFEDEMPIKFDYVPIEELEPGQVYPIRGLVKDIDNKPDYIRVDVEDESGMASFFTTRDAKIEKGKVILALVYDKDLLGFAYAEDLTVKIQNHYELGQFEQFLINEKVFSDDEVLYNYSIGKIGDSKVLLLPIHIRRFKIRNGNLKGKWMGTMVATDGEKYERYVMFPDTYREVQASLVPFTPIVIRPNKTRDGGQTFNAKDFILASDLKRRKGI